MKKISIALTMILAVLITACGGETIPPTPTTTPMPAITPTLDMCSEANLPGEVEKVNSLMREFDDYATLASNTPQAQLVVVIPELQRVLRNAEEQAVPECLAPLKDLQVTHMSLVVQTLLAFMGNSDANLVNAGIAKARDVRVQYDIEMARLLGITLVAPSPAPSQAPLEPTATPTPLVTNPGPNELNLRTAPDFNAPAPDVLAVQATAPAIGKTADSLWIQIEVPNKPGTTAWVYATNVELSISIEQLPVVTP